MKVPVSATALGLIPVIVPVWDGTDCRYRVVLFDRRMVWKSANSGSMTLAEAREQVRKWHRYHRQLARKRPGMVPKALRVREAGVTRGATHD